MFSVPIVLLAKNTPTAGPVPKLLNVDGAAVRPSVNCWRTPQFVLSRCGKAHVAELSLQEDVISAFVKPVVDGVSILVVQKAIKVDRAVAVAILGFSSVVTVLELRWSFLVPPWFLV